MPVERPNFSVLMLVLLERGLLLLIGYDVGAMGSPCGCDDVTVAMLPDIIREDGELVGYVSQRMSGQEGVFCTGGEGQKFWKGYFIK